MSCQTYLLRNVIRISLLLNDRKFKKTGCICIISNHIMALEKDRQFYFCLVVIGSAVVVTIDLS